MSHLEKKYRVDTFEQVISKLEVLGAEKQSSVDTTHWYADTKTNNVTKLVAQGETFHVHCLAEQDGLFTLSKKVPIATKEAGFAYLSQRGFKEFQKVTMTNTDYCYQNGVVGLYLLDSRIASVILHFPKEYHQAIEKRLGLDIAERITIPYNLYLAGG